MCENDILPGSANVSSALADRLTVDGLPPATEAAPIIGNIGVFVDENQPQAMISTVVTAGVRNRRSFFGVGCARKFLPGRKPMRPMRAGDLHNVCTTVDNVNVRPAR